MCICCLQSVALQLYGNCFFQAITNSIYIVSLPEKDSKNVKKIPDKNLSNTLQIRCRNKLDLYKTVCNNFENQKQNAQIYGFEHEFMIALKNCLYYYEQKIVNLKYHIYKQATYMFCESVFL